MMWAEFALLFANQDKGQASVVVASVLESRAHHTQTPQAE